MLNQLVGEKVSITSSKPQTTRYCIRGILTTKVAQFIFVDTPGLQNKIRGNALNRAMNTGIAHCLNEVDVVVWVIEAMHYDQRDVAVGHKLPTDKPVVIAINKIDKLHNKNKLLPFVEQIAQVHPDVTIVPVSGQKKLQLEVLLEEIARRLPMHPPYYEAEQLTDRDERFHAAELLREKIFRNLGEELPYATAVVIDKFEQVGSLRRIFASVWVDKPNHRAILLGEKGARMKKMATLARQDMQHLFDSKVYLEVWVKVKTGWADDARILRQWFQ